MSIKLMGRGSDLSRHTREEHRSHVSAFNRLLFGLPGRIFRSPMPFGPYDLHGEVYDQFCEEQITVIVMLASDEECLHKTGCNLRALYLKEGFEVLYLPIPDFGV